MADRCPTAPQRRDGRAGGACGGVGCCMHRWIAAPWRCSGDQGGTADGTGVNLATAAARRARPNRACSSVPSSTSCRRRTGRDTATATPALPGPSSQGATRTRRRVVPDTALSPLQPGRRLRLPAAQRLRRRKTIAAIDARIDARKSQPRGRFTATRYGHGAACWGGQRGSTPFA